METNPKSLELIKTTPRSIGLIFILLISILASSNLVYGADGAAMQILTGGGFSTYKSEAVTMNDTSTAIGYGFVIRAGNNGDIGVNWEQFTNKTKFEINTSESKIDFQDTAVLFNLGSFYIGPVFSKVAMDIDAGGTAILSGIGSGYGFDTGFSFETGKSSEVYFDVRYITTSTFKAEDGVTASVGSRLDYRIGGVIPITKRFMSLDFAWRSQSWSVTIDGTEHKETLYTTWIGTRFNLNI